MFELIIEPEADEKLRLLRTNKTYDKRYKAVSKTLRFLSQNPKHPSLQTHEYHGLRGMKGEKVFEAYAEQHTAGAYRVFWHYGPRPRQITILSITPHP